MKVLVIARKNQSIAPFILEQIESLKEKNIHIELFTINKGGLLGYLNHLLLLRKFLKHNNFDILHAHYCLSGLLLFSKKNIKKVITFHGDDINNFILRQISKIVIKHSDYSIFVSEKLAKKIKKRKPYSILPCGVDEKIFFSINRNLARNILNLPQDEIIILFSSNFSIRSKRPKLAFKSIALISKKIYFVELKNMSRKMVNLYLNACNLLLMTSKNEGSPQIIKEALLCGTPIVSTDVGDVKELIDDINGCFIAKSDPLDISKKIMLAIEFSKNFDKTSGREKIIKKKLTLHNISDELLRIYYNLLKY